MATATAYQPSFTGLVAEPQPKPAQYVQVVSLRMVRDSEIKWAGDQITQPAHVYHLVSSLLADADREHLAAIALDTKQRPLGFYTVSVGTLNATAVSGREVFKTAVVMNANSIVLVHNHPSGDPTPSPEDIAASRSLKEAGKLLGIELLDHIVVGEGRWVSLREKGQL